MNCDTAILHIGYSNLLVRVSPIAVIECRWIGPSEYDISNPPITNLLLKETMRQFEEYFALKRKVFTIPIHLEGTQFQMKVWQELLKIPYGRTVSYSELARRVGKPTACRAAAQACHNNPVALIVPCHRVIGKSGALTGYAGGLKIKSRLLVMEKAPGLFRGLDY